MKKLESKIHSQTREISCSSTFEKHLENALKYQNDENQLEKISIGLFNSFQILISLLADKSKWSELFEIIDKIETFFKLLRSDKAKQLKQDEYYRLIGDLFYKIDKELYSLDFYNRSVKLSNGTNLLSIESYENLINSLVERWHYRMLNDNIRNEAYKKAILNKISLFKQTSANEQLNILDIGTGTGLLSAICLAEALKVFQDSEKIHIYSCEMNSFFYNISNKFLGSLDYPKSIKVLNKHSNDLNKTEDFNNETINLIISEIFDDGLLGEGCLDTFYNALTENNLVENKLKHPSSCLIPCAAKIYLCAIESEHLKQSNSYIEKFDSNKIINAKCLDSAFKFAKYSNSDFNYEPYTTENIQKLEFKQIVEVVELNELDIKFDDINFLEKYCKFNEITTIKKKLKVMQNGRIDAFVIWFDLYLDDVITLTNSPFESSDDESKFYSKCWHQALYSISEENLVTVDQEINIEVIFSKDCILVNNIFKEEAPKPFEINLSLNRHEISLLNNNNYQEFYCRWFEDIYSEISTNQASSSKKISIGYLSNTFSRIFFKLVLEYYTRFKKEKNIDLVVELFLNDCVTDENFELNLYENFEEFEFLKIQHLNELLEKNTTQKNEIFNLNYLICEPVDFKYGILRKNFLTDLAFIKDFNSIKDLVIFPSVVQLSGICVESSSLLNESELINDENLCISPINHNFKDIQLRQILSDYRTRHLYSISINNLGEYKQLTEKLDIEQIHLNNLSLETNTNTREIYFDVKQDGQLDALICCYELYDKLNSKCYTPFEFFKTKKYYQTESFAAIAFYEKAEIKMDSHEKICIDFISNKELFNMKFKTFISKS